MITSKSPRMYLIYASFIRTEEFLYKIYQLKIQSMFQTPVNLIEIRRN